MLLHHRVNDQTIITRHCITGINNSQHFSSCITGPTAANLLQRPNDGPDRQTDGRTLDSFVDLAPHTMPAVPIIQYATSRSESMHNIFVIRYVSCIL